MPAPYTLFKRGKTWYVQFRDAAGNRTTAKSTGCARKDDAQDWAAEEFRKHGYNKPSKRITFAEYAENWWVPGKCPYTRRRRAEGKELSAGYVAANRGLLQTHIIPEFGKRRLDEITRAQIEDWKVKLFETSGRAAETVNHALKVLKLMLREAYRREIIRGNPGDLVGAVSGPSKERVALTLKQARTLLGDRKHWPDFRHYVLNLTAFTTGARLGELQALQWQNVHEDYIAIVQSWDRRTKTFKEPKWGSNRVVPIPDYTRKAMDELRRSTGHGKPSDLVFPSANGTPMDPHEVNKKLRDGVASAKIKVDFTFHGWRHTYVSLLRTAVDDTKLMMLTRHKSQALVERYTHQQIEHFSDVRDIQNDWLSR
jgi:integrase